VGTLAVIAANNVTMWAIANRTQKLRNVIQAAQSLHNWTPPRWSDTASSDSTVKKKNPHSLNASPQPCQLKQTQQSPVYVSQKTILCPVIFFFFCRLLCLKLLRTGSEDPHHHEQEFLFYYLII
jgi:hypothetical protein